MVALWTVLVALLGCGGGPRDRDPGRAGPDAPEARRPKAPPPGAKARRRPAPPAAPGQARDQIVLELAPGYERTAYLLLPPSYDPQSDKRWPVLYGFHGGRGRGRGRHLAPSWKDHRDTFIQVFPDGQDLELGRGAWWSPPGKPTTDEFVAALVAEIDRRFETDPSRRYVAGFSAGALYTYRLVCSSELFHAFAAVSHPMLVETPEVCSLDHPRPFLISSGTADPRHDGHELNGNTYAPMRDTMAFWAKTNGCRPTPRETPLPPAEGDRTRPTRFTFEGCRAPFRYIEITGAGHTWPGGEAGPDETGERSRFALSDEIVSFFRDEAQL
ncbi:MAG TPA: hypothetical protein ENK18_07735 [Deltaproteobacteria bacterium]|nr:hypothetical protein [Deltaproteobacteria bacterium]